MSDKNETYPQILNSRTQLSLSFTVPPNAILEYHTRNKEHLRERSPACPDDWFSLPFWEKKQKELKTNYQTIRTVVPWVIQVPNKPTVIGSINYSQIFRAAFQAAYVGYSMDEEYCRKGLMTEALESTVQYMFRSENLHRIMANYMPDNHGSARLLEKLHFEIEGRAKGYLRINGRWEDHVLTARTNSEWRPKDPNK